MPAIGSGQCYFVLFNFVYCQFILQMIYLTLKRKMNKKEIEVNVNFIIKRFAMGDSIIIFWSVLSERQQLYKELKLLEHPPIDLYLEELQSPRL